MSSKCNNCIAHCGDDCNCYGGDGCTCCRGPRGRRGPPGGPQILVQDMLPYSRTTLIPAPRFLLGSAISPTAQFVQIRILENEVQNFTSIGESSFVANSDPLFTASRPAIYHVNLFLRAAYRDAYSGQTGLTVLVGEPNTLVINLATNGVLVTGSTRTLDFSLSGQLYFPTANSALYLLLAQNFSTSLNPITTIDGSISLQFLRYTTTLPGDDDDNAALRRSLPDAGSEGASLPDCE